MTFQQTSPNPPCTHCKSERTVKCGLRNNIQQYRCRNCKKVFSAITDTANSKPVVAPQPNREPWYTPFLIFRKPNTKSQMDTLEKQRLAEEKKTQELESLLAIKKKVADAKKKNAMIRRDIERIGKL